jgi:hypothetical protein
MDGQARLLGFDDGPDPLLVGYFEPVRGQAEAGSKLLFALNPLAEVVVGLHPFRVSTSLSAVQQTGRLMPAFWSNATRPPPSRRGVFRTPASRFVVP